MQVRHRVGLAALAAVLCTTVLLVIPSLGLAANVVAGPIVNPNNGSTYYVLGNTNNWFFAESEAESLGGHLATDNNPAEDQWMRDNLFPLTAPFYAGQAVWIGLNDNASEGHFVWVSGESTPAWPAAAFNTPFYNSFPWRISGEPNGGYGENCVYLDLGPHPFGGWVDYPCVGASDPLVGIVEVDGPSAPTPQSITFTSSPSAPAVGGTYDVSATGGGSGNPVTFTIDGTSTAGTCSIAGSTVSFSAVGTCIVDANQAGGGGYADAPQVSQSIDVAKGTPVVSWSPASLAFGTPLGAAQLNASPSVPGTFAYLPAAGAILDPGVQTLTASFTPTDTADWNTVGATASVNVTTSIPPISSGNGPINIGNGGSAAITGSTSGPVTVGAGGSLYVGPGGSINGPLNVSPGATVVVNGGTVNGPLKATADLYLTLCGATVTGKLDISGSAGTLVVGSTGGCAGNLLEASVSLTNNTGGVSFVGNHATSAVTITGNSGGFSYSGNTIDGKAKVSGNS